MLGLNVPPHRWAIPVVILVSSCSAQVLVSPAVRVPVVRIPPLLHAWVSVRTSHHLRLFMFTHS